MGLSNYRYEQIINSETCYIIFKINAKNIENNMVTGDWNIEDSCVNYTKHTINLMEYTNILKKNKEIMELFLNIRVIIVYKGFWTLKFIFQNKYKIIMHKLMLIPYHFSCKLILQLYNFLSNDFIGNACSYNYYFIASREVGIWTN